MLRSQHCTESQNISVEEKGQVQNSVGFVTFEYSVQTWFYLSYSLSLM